ncbi:hypothetical protein F5882DRAFT_289174, partial [Hyaloscypha sp. PMI_1271]
VIAAPWSCALLTKLDRMAGGGGKPYDPGDAAKYLRQYLLLKKLRNVLISAIQQVAQIIS